METMSNRYPSKVGKGLVLFLVLVMGGTSFLIALQNFLLGLIQLILVALFIFHLFLTNVYIIEGRNLIIRSGFLYHKVIDIEKIKKITPTSPAMSSAAASLDRLELLCNAFDTGLISPKGKEGLAKHLKEINSTIENKSVTPWSLFLLVQRSTARYTLMGRNTYILAEGLSGNECLASL